MDADLLTIARRLAEGGHLPWIDVSRNRLGTDGEPLVFSNADPRLLQATEADLLFACHEAIDRRGWIAVRNSKSRYLAILTGGCEVEKHGSRFRFEEHGTTTLSLLTVFSAALEATP